MSFHNMKSLGLHCFRGELRSILCRKDILLKRFTTRLSSTKVEETNATLKESPKSDNAFNQTEFSAAASIDETKEVGSFAKSLKKMTTPSPPPKKAPEMSFAALFRQSNFAHLGDASGRVVSGRIERVVEDDLYINFGWKFHCVVKRPSEDSHLYIQNATVRLRIIDLEMSTIFLGATKETSLNEANCMLLGLEKTPFGKSQFNQPAA